MSSSTRSATISASPTPTCTRSRMQAEASVSLLALEGVACRRGGRLLFEGLSLTLGPGEAALVTGPNGAGKSSLIRLAAGLLRARRRHGRARPRPRSPTSISRSTSGRRLGDALAFWAGSTAPIRAGHGGDGPRPSRRRAGADAVDRPAQARGAGPGGGERRAAVAARRARQRPRRATAWSGSPRRWRRTAPAAAPSSPPRTSRSAWPARRRWRSDDRARSCASCASPRPAARPCCR